MRRASALLVLGAFLAACGSGGQSPAPSVPVASSGAVASASPTSAAASGALPSGWTTFTSPDGSFTVGMPGQPTATTQTANTALGPIEIHIFVYQTSTIAYTVDYNDYPAAALDGKDPSVILSGGVQGAVQNAKATLQSSTPVTLGSTPGVEWVAAVTGGTLHGRMYLSGSRLYQLLVAGAGSELPDLDAFFSSFAILR